jgi:ATP-dependent DNA helicase RecG
MRPEDLVTKHFRLVPAQQAALRKLKIHSIEDVLYHFPVRYERAGGEGRVHALVPKTKVSLVGMFSKLEAKKLWKSRRTATEGWFEDGTGKVKVLWFNQPYIAKMTPQGVAVRLSGMVAGTPEKPYITNPEVSVLSGHESTGLFASDTDDTVTPLFPVYPESAGITSRWFFHALARVFESGVHKMLVDPIPAATRERLHLPELSTALVWMHVPEEERHTETARKRFAFEEMFVLHTGKTLERIANTHEDSFPIPDAQERIDTFVNSLEHIAPTGAQTRALTDIAHALSSPHPMARLLEGDVGSGKTLVAAAAAYAAITSRPQGRTSGLPAQAGTLQVAYMAPTEILAQQHFESFIRYFKHLPVSIGLITGSGCKKFPSKTARGGSTPISRTQLLKWVAQGEIAFVVGTHALIQKSVQFRHLALAIVDEQHRFGTAQRRALARKGDAIPHFLSMTATPIPRTLALTLYGDLDISVIDELPPGRAQVTTRIVSEEKRPDMYTTMRHELAAGRQAYVICPRIEEPDPTKLNALMAKSAKAEAQRLQKDVFPEYTVGLLHGAMTPTEKDAAMRDFEHGNTHILVATSVVEVGVNVPNATVIIIEGAERFGLSQLHQLRGRVQRSSHAPYCFLAPDTKSALSLKRLRALEKSSDGFELAEADLQLRGAGDLFGSQQWGVSDLGMEALKNPRLIEAARIEAQTIVEEDPTLAQHPALALRAAATSRELHGE